jgi:hypothetical protein
VVENSGSASPGRPARRVGARPASPSPASPSTNTRTGRLNAPRPALVEPGFDGTPKLVNRQLVSIVREEWRVVDRWWTEEPVDRRYFDVVLESGQNVCVYRDQEASAWFTQNA